MDALDAFRRLGSPVTKYVPAPSLGYPYPCYPHSAWLCGGGIVLKRGDDSKQPEEGGESKGCWKEEGIR